MDAKKWERIRELLDFMYGGKRAAELSAKIIPLLDAFPAGNGNYGFTNRDALLISYGDMFSPAEGDNTSSGLGRLKQFLDTWNNGAFTYIHILPFYPYSSDDGFSVIDYRAVDSRFGSWADIEKLGTDTKLVFDFVINHGSVQSSWFRAFLDNDAGYRNWYITRPKEYDYSRVVRPRTHPLLSPFKKTDGSDVYVWTTFSPDQADYDFPNPDVLIEFIRIFLEYAARGAKIIRLDAIAYLWKEDGTSCLHHPKTHAVVKLLRAIIEALNLDMKILTETNVPHEQNISYFGKGDEAHMVYNFALPPLVLHAAISGDAVPLREWAKALPSPASGQLFLNFLASHDGVGLTPANGLVDPGAFRASLDEAVRRGALVSYKASPEGELPYELNCSYADVTAPKSMGSAELRSRVFIAGQAVLLSLPGLPALYMHSFIGSEAWDEGPGLLGYKRAINREKPGIDIVEKTLQDPSSFRAQVYHHFQRLFDFRRKEEAFHPSADFRILNGDRAVFAILRGPGENGGYVLCMHNFSGKEAFCPLPGEYEMKTENRTIRLDAWESRWIAFAGGRLIRELSTAEP